MAKTQDNTAQKKKQQTIMLAVGGVILLALLAIQLPKILGGNDAAPAPATEATGTTTGTTGTSTPGATPVSTVPVVAAGAPRTVLVGVTVGGTGSTPAGQGQLRLFTLFKAKDPFVQSLPSETSGTTTATSQPTLSDTEPGSSGSSGSESSSGEESNVAPTPSAPEYATIVVNSENEPLSVKDKFPEGENVFVLVSLKERSAKIAVAGGSFTDGQAVTLQLGKSLTLVNTATGARYALKLVFVGDQPEEVQGFTQGAKKAK